MHLAKKKEMPLVDILRSLRDDGGSGAHAADLAPYMTEGNCIQAAIALSLGGGFRPCPRRSPECGRTERLLRIAA